METSSWIVVGAYCALTLGIGLAFSRRAARSTEEYFLSGRTLPWWLIGTSMVVTTFGPDTPLGVAEYSREGVYKNWFGWHMVLGQVLAVFLFARLWRRSGVMTDNELIELRYDGRAAAVLRAFKACHFSIVYNLLTLATVTSAMVEVVSQTAGVDPELARWSVVGVALVYCALAGFWGVVATDFLQFWVAVAGTTLFAWLACRHYGGLEAARLAADASAFAFWPGPGIGRAEVLVFVLILWWGHANADGGGYLIQRMCAAKDERHASLGTLWFSVAYAAVRMWPWILIGSLSLVTLPRIEAHGGELRVNGRPADRVTGTVLVAEPPEDGREVPAGLFTGKAREVEDLPLRVAPPSGGAPAATADGRPVAPVPGREAYPRMMATVLDHHPVLLGILVAAFLAAFMSTVDTHLNWGASYLVNDVLRRFVVRRARDRSLVWVAKGLVVLMMMAAVVGSQHIGSIRGAWIFNFAISAGLGPVILMRWFWWRVNAWSEIAALATSLVTAVGFELLNWRHDPGRYAFAARVIHAFGVPLADWQRALFVIAFSIAAAVVATFLSRPTSPGQLARFVERVRPPGAWGPVRARVGPAARPDHGVPGIALRWALGVMVVYGITFVIGALLYGHRAVLAGAALALVVGSIGLALLFRRRPA